MRALHLLIHHTILENFLQFKKQLNVKKQFISIRISLVGVYEENILILLINKLLRYGISFRKN